MKCWLDRCILLLGCTFPALFLQEIYFHLTNDLRRKKNRNWYKKHNKIDQVLGKWPLHRNIIPSVLLELLNCSPKYLSKIHNSVDFSILDLSKLIGKCKTDEWIYSPSIHWWVKKVKRFESFVRLDITSTWLRVLKYAFFKLKITPYLHETFS